MFFFLSFGVFGCDVLDVVMFFFCFDGPRLFTLHLSLDFVARAFLSGFL